jgi:transposase-like protein
MARPPVFPAEEKVRIVLSILAGEVTVAEAARRAKVSEQSVGNWKRQFLEARQDGLGSRERPHDVHIGLADPRVPNFPEPEILPTA